MRLKRNRLKTFYLRKCEVKKDSEGGTYEEYGEAVSFTGEAWPASGKVQAAQYGERLGYIYNLRMDGAYEESVDEEGHIHYVFPDGPDVRERDGVCLFVTGDAAPDYRIISIRPYRFLKLEVERI